MAMPSLYLLVTRIRAGLSRSGQRLVPGRGSASMSNTTPAAGVGLAADFWGLRATVVELVLFR